MTQSKQGISSIELGRRLGVTQTTAWKIKQLAQVMLERRPDGEGYGISTVPPVGRDVDTIAFHNKAVAYAILFRAAAEASLILFTKPD